MCAAWRNLQKYAERRGMTEDQGQLFGRVSLCFCNALFNVIALVAAAANFSREA